MVVPELGMCGAGIGNVKPELGMWSRNWDVFRQFRDPFSHFNAGYTLYVAIFRKKKLVATRSIDFPTILPCFQIFSTTYYFSIWSPVFEPKLHLLFIYFFTKSALSIQSCSSYLYLNPDVKQMQYFLH